MERGGRLGIVTWYVKSLGGAQVFADLVIALMLFIVWMWRDAQATRPPRLALADCHAGFGINRAASVFAEAPSASCKPMRSAAAPLRPSCF